MATTGSLSAADNSALYFSNTTTGDTRFPPSPHSPHPLPQQQLQASSSGEEQQHGDLNPTPNVTKRCSVRGCAQPLPLSASNKMCDTCRGRHRVYASTKRMRRKMEKASLAGVVVMNARNAQLHGQVLASAGGEGGGEIGDNQQAWMGGGHQMASTTVPTPHSWDHSIDPRLFHVGSSASAVSPAVNAVVPHQHHQHHQLQRLPLTSSSSELANALTLPTPSLNSNSNGYYSVHTVQQSPPQHQGGQEEEEEGGEGEEREEGETAILGSQFATIPTTNSGSTSNSPSPSSNSRSVSASTSTNPPPHDPSHPPRYCSVKGCKAVIPGSYQFKMCPPCRTRYRTYGTTKRAKWKAEREAFDREMKELRMVEDERRRVGGLSPLAECPEELREWEMSIIDEQIPLPPQVLAVLSAGASASIGAAAAGGVGGEGEVDGTGTLGLVNPNNILNVYQGNPASIDTPNSVVPYPQIMGILPPLPARMCTVSHCHQILPGFYRYKRCEQHRLQNRHHSKLKRVREKVVKAEGPEEGASVVEVGREEEGARNKAGRGEDEGEDDGGEADVQGEDGVRDEAGTRREKRKTKHKNKVDGEEEMDGVINPPLFTHTPIDVTPPQDQTALKAEENMKKRGKYSCLGDACQNLLNPGVRWRTCDECRIAQRRRKFHIKMAANKAGQEQADIAAEDDEEHTHTTTTGTQSELTSMEVDTAPKYTRKPTNDLRMVNVTASSFEQPKDNWTTSTASFSTPTSLSTSTSTSTSTGSDTAHSIVAGNSLTFKEYKPKTTGSAIGRLLAQNPHVGVEVFKELLGPNAEGVVVDLSTTDQPANSKRGSESISATPSSSGSGNSLPTPTIPQSTPFVYYAPSTSRRGQGQAQGEAGSNPADTVSPGGQQGQGGGSAAGSATATVSGKSKGKTKAKNKSSIPSTSTPTPSTSTPTPTSSTVTMTPASASLHQPQNVYAPYPYAQYPYPFPYNYYIPPPYGMPPYTYLPLATASGSGEGSKGTGEGVVTNANPSPNAANGMPGYAMPPYQYPYIQQAGYGYPPHPHPLSHPPPFGAGANPAHVQAQAHAHGYNPYVPPRYMPQSYAQQQQHSSQHSVGIPSSGSGSGVGAGSGGKATRTPAGAGTATGTSGEETGGGTGEGGGNECGEGAGAGDKAPVLAKPKEAKFSYYHYGVGNTDSPDLNESQKRKRRKVDPAWLEKMRVQQDQVKKTAAEMAAEESMRHGARSTVPDVGGTSDAVGGGGGEIGVGIFEHQRPGGGGEGEGVDDPPTHAADPEQQQRTCHAKACHRLIPTGVSSTLCEKCKARFKRHQVKTKQRFKLEPKKSLVGRVGEGDAAVRRGG